MYFKNQSSVCLAWEERLEGEGAKMGQRKRAMFGRRLFLSSHHTLQISGGLKRVFALSGMHPDQQRIKNLNEKKNQLLISVLSSWTRVQLCDGTVCLDFSNIHHADGFCFVEIKL